MRHKRSDTASLAREVRRLQSRLDALEGKPGTRREKGVTVREWWERWDLSDLSDLTQRNIRGRTRAYVEAYADIPIRRLRSGREWAKEHRGQARYLSQMFDAAIDAGVADRNPFEGLVRALKPLPALIPTVANVDRLAWAAEDCFSRAILVAAYTGLRRCELLALEAQDVERVPSLRIRVRSGKGGRERVVPVLGPAKFALLQALPEVGRVFPWDEREHRTRWEAVRGQAGLPGVRWHSLRKFFVTWLLEQGVSAEDAALAAHGHFDPRLVVEVYGRPGVQAGLRRIEGLTDAQA